MQETGRDGAVNGNFKLNDLVLKLLDLVFASIYWLVACIPIFTIGAANAALYYSAQKVLKNDRGTLQDEFWGSFKRNFKVATLCWLPLLALGLLFAGEGYVCYQIWRQGDAVGWFWVAFLVLGILEGLLIILLFPYIARFDDGVGRTLKNCIFILFLNLPRCVASLLLLVAIVAAAIYMPPILLVAPAAYMFLNTYLLEKVFWKYMSEEDREAEEARNAPPRDEM